MEYDPHTGAHVNTRSLPHVDVGVCICGLAVLLKHTEEAEEASFLIFGDVVLLLTVLVLCSIFSFYFTCPALMLALPAT